LINYIDDGDEEEGREETEMNRNRNNGFQSGSARSQDTGTALEEEKEEADKRYETRFPEKSDRAYYGQNAEADVRGEQDDDASVHLSGSGLDDTEIHDDDDDDEEHPETRKDSESMSEVLLDSKDERYSGHSSFNPGYPEQNPREKNLESGDERYSEIFPTNPDYVERNSKKSGSVVQTIDEERVSESSEVIIDSKELNNKEEKYIETSSLLLHDRDRNIHSSVEDEVVSYKEADLIPQPLSEELEELAEIQPFRSGNHLDVVPMRVGLKDQRLTPRFKGQAAALSTDPSNITTQSNASGSVNAANADENIIKESPVVIVNSDVDVKGSIAMRRSAALASSLMDLQRENGNNLEELEDSNVKSRAASPFEEETALPDNVCKLPVVTGACKGSFPRFYYSPEVRSCIPFTYTGCGQNANNFETAEDCAATCEPNRKSRNTGQKEIEHKENKDKHKLEFGSSDSGTGIYNRNRVRRKFPLAFCTLELDVGEICPDLKRGLYLEDFFYDSRINQCAPFVYSGCGGNANRFSSIWECTSNCVTNSGSEASSAIYEASVPHI